jgi:hypothetical protein
MPRSLHQGDRQSTSSYVRASQVAPSLYNASQARSNIDSQCPSNEASRKVVAPSLAFPSPTLTLCTSKGMHLPFFQFSFAFSRSRNFRFRDKGNDKIILHIALIECYFILSASSCAALLPLPILLGFEALCYISASKRKLWQSMQICGQGCSACCGLTMPDDLHQEWVRAGWSRS